VAGEEVVDVREHRQHALLHRFVAHLAAVGVDPDHPVGETVQPRRLLAEERAVALALKAFLVYSAVILSFLGGVRWGRVMSAGGLPSGYVLAVLPSLWAFPALFLPPLHALAALAAGFGLALWFDTRADALPATPGFRQLRRQISAAVIAAHGMAMGLCWHFGGGLSPA